MSKKVIVNGMNIGYLPPTNASEINYDMGGGNYTTVQDIIEEIDNKIPTVVNKVYEENSTGNAPYRILLSASYDDTSKDDTAKKSSKLNFNPATGRLNHVGDYYIDKQDGTTSTIGESTITLGNSIASGTDKNSKGVIRIYSDSGYQHRIQVRSDLTANRYLNMPDRSGDIALTSDLTADTVSYSSGVSVKTQIDKKGGKITEVNLQHTSFTYDSSSKMWVSNNPFSYYYGTRKIYSIDVKPGYAATVANAFITDTGYIGVVGIATTTMSVMGEGSTFRVHFVLEEYN